MKKEDKELKKIYKSLIKMSQDASPITDDDFDKAIKKLFSLSEAAFFMPWQDLSNWRKK